MSNPAVVVASDTQINSVRTSDCSATTLPTASWMSFFWVSPHCTLSLRIRVLKLLLHQNFFRSHCSVVPYSYGLHMIGGHWPIYTFTRFYRCSPPYMWLAITSYCHVHHPHTQICVFGLVIDLLSLFRQYSLSTLCPCKLSHCIVSISIVHPRILIVSFSLARISLGLTQKLFHRTMWRAVKVLLPNDRLYWRECVSSWARHGVELGLKKLLKH